MLKWTAREATLRQVALSFAAWVGTMVPKWAGDPHDDASSFSDSSFLFFPVGRGAYSPPPKFDGNIRSQSSIGMDVRWLGRRFSLVAHQGVKGGIVAMTKLDIGVAALGAICSLSAAGFWLRASLIAVPDNIDTFIEVLQRSGKINGAAAAFGCVAAFCAAYAFARSAGIIGPQ